MAKKFIKLTDDAKFDFVLIGIVCNHRDYRLGMAINKKLDINLSKQDEYTVSRAFVAVADPNDPAQRASNLNTAADADLWDAMDAAADDVALVFAGGLLKGVLLFKISLIRNMSRQIF